MCWFFLRTQFLDCHSVASSVHKETSVARRPAVDRSEVSIVVEEEGGRGRGRWRYIRAEARRGGESRVIHPGAFVLLILYGQKYSQHGCYECFGPQHEVSQTQIKVQ